MKAMNGHTTVEFAMVGSVFLVLLFGIFEIGRILFLWNTLTEATRRGARMAIICPVGHDAILRTALFNENDNNNAILPNMSTGDFKLEYLDDSGNVLPQPGGSFLSIRFVRVSIREGQEVSTIIPGISQLLELPDFSTTLPIESMGVSRDNAASQCQGSIA